MQAVQDAARRVAVISSAKGKGGKGGKGSDDSESDSGKGKGKGKGDEKAGTGADLQKVAADTKKDAVSLHSSSKNWQLHGPLTHGRAF